MPRNIYFATNAAKNLTKHAATPLLASSQSTSSRLLRTSSPELSAKSSFSNAREKKKEKEPAGLGAAVAERHEKRKGLWGKNEKISGHRETLKYNVKPNWAPRKMQDSTGACLRMTPLYDWINIEGASV